MGARLDRYSGKTGVGTTRGLAIVNISYCAFQHRSFGLPEGVETLGPTKLTVWAPLYFFFEVLGRACFYCGGWFALLYLLTNRYGDRFHTPIVWGFVLFTIAQVVGAIWCWLGWAATFQWVNIHFQAAAVWCFFANYLHVRFLPKWDLRKKAGFAFAGTVIMLGISIIGYVRFFGEARIGG